MTLSERTKLEMREGKRARLAYCLREQIPLGQIWSKFDGRCVLHHVGEKEVIVEVTSPKGDVVHLTDSLDDFPSDVLLAQCTLVAG